MSKPSFTPTFYETIFDFNIFDYLILLAFHDPSENVNTPGRKHERRLIKNALRQDKQKLI